MEAFDGLQAWLEAETQLQRVLKALASLLERLPALERASAAASAEDSDSTEDSQRMPASACQACYVKQVAEAERLAAYLGPLMSQLGNAAAQVERAAGGLEEGQQRSSSEVALACRSLLGMLSQELWRKQALAAQLTALLGPLFLYSASSLGVGTGAGAGRDPVEAAVATVRDVVQAWPLEGAESLVDMALVRDMVASPSLGLGPPRRAQLLQALGEL